MIAITTLGKFTGIPTKAASAKYGGGTSAAAELPQKPKFPRLKIKKVRREDEDINISVTNVTEEN